MVELGILSRPVPTGPARPRAVEPTDLPRPRHPVSSRREGDHANLAELLQRFSGLAVASPERDGLRDVLVTGYLGVAHNLARRYRNRGVPLDDLEQVATVGLINAVDRFDPSRGDQFLAFAVPTITGEIRRYFRDQTWSMRVPRRLKELRGTIRQAVGSLQQTLGRAPRPSELATYLNVELEEVLEALNAAEAYRSDSLDATLSHGEADSASVGDMLGEYDVDLDLVELHESLQPLLAELPARERSILMMRFYGNMTQTQIAERIGISQMHVSRLLANTLAGLRKALETG